MCSTYKIQVMFVQEFRHYFSPECEGDSTVVLSPAHRLLVWVRPEEITE